MADEESAKHGTSGKRHSVGACPPSVGRQLGLHILGRVRTVPRRSLRRNIHQNLTVSFIQTVESNVIELAFKLHPILENPLVFKTEPHGECM